MSTLQSLAPGIHFLPGAVNSLVLEDGQGGALLVDTGLDESHARKLWRALEGAKLRPTAILNTHSHADHHGGNAWLLGRCPGLEIWAPPLEAALIQHPLLEPLSLYGACPPPDLRTRFLLAPSSPARPLAQVGSVTLGAVELELLPVPGHAVQLYAVRAGEVLYATDALFGPESLQKHPLTFCADAGQQRASAQALGRLSGVNVTLPGHGAPTSDLQALAQLNLEAYQRTTAAVLEAVSLGAASVDELLGRVCALFNVQMTNASAWVLNRAVVSAHLSLLSEQGRVQLEMLGNRLCFKLT